MAGPSPAPRRAQLAAEDADDFEMRAVLELVHRRDPLDAVAAGDEDRGVAHEGAGIAGDADDDRDSCCGELPCLCLRPGARGIDHERVEALELRCEERAPEEVARLRRDAAQARRLARSARRSAKGPQPAKRSATRFALWHAATTMLASASSPAWVACRKPPGASESWALPMRRSGARRSSSTSPCRERRARSCRPATSISA